MAQITTSEQKLQTWASHIQLKKDSATYQRVKDVFADFRPNNSNNYEIYLQGSVANHTNIRADGDIDIVLQLNSTFYYEYLYEPTIYRNSSGYTQRQFRQSVIFHLDTNGITYKVKNTCIKLNLRGDQWQDVDLIPCFQYRRHYGSGQYQFHEGIKIETPSGDTIINYPKIHKANGENKNGRASYYKQMVRIFKNIKSRLIDENLISESLAPSYFVECLIYNIPDAEFSGSSYQSILANCLSWINNNNLQDMPCQNEITTLFGSSSTQWNETSCRDFIAKVIGYVTR